MKKVQKADEAGVYDPPADEATDDPGQASDSRSPHHQA
jgi:hypothetical protein